MTYAAFSELCGDIPWIAEAYQRKKITDDGLKELLFYLTDAKGKDVSLLLPQARLLLLDHVRIFLQENPRDIINRLTVTKKLRSPGFMLERDIYRHCADIEAYVRTRKERFRLALIRLYGPQHNELYQNAWRTDFAHSFAAANYVHCRLLIFLFGFRKISYIPGMHQDDLRRYEDRLLLCAREYALDLAFLKKSFAGEYQHVSRKIVSAAPYTEALAKDRLHMIGLQ